MTKLIVTLSGIFQQEYTNNKPRINIGRRKANDLYLDHLTVSGQHAAIDTTLNGIFILDLGSTNGTKVNGQPIKKHLLQNEDIIEIGKYKLRFLVDTIAPITSPFASTIARDTIGVNTISPVINQATLVAPIPLAKIKVLNGNHAGREMMLNKSTTHLGNATSLVVSITREKNAYFVKFVEGKTGYKINDMTMDNQAHLLNDGDVLELAGTKIVFMQVS